MPLLRAVLAALAIAATAEAFTATQSQCIMLRRPPAAVSTYARARVSARPARLALRMQSEDDKAKAAGAGLFLFGLVYSGFSVFWGVLAGGVAVYAAKLPEEGDKGLSDTAKQASLLVGTYVIKAVEFIKEKDAEEGLSKQIVDRIKGVVDDAKAKIEK